MTDTNEASPNPTLEQQARKAALAKLRDRAFGYLARREHSAHELREKLTKRDEFDQTDDLVDELIERGLQSDERFAEHLGRVRTGSGKGPVALKTELHKHRIADEIVETVLATYESEWNVLAEQVRVRKFGNEAPVDYKEWARQARFLQQRGFTSAQIRRHDSD